MSEVPVDWVSKKPADYCKPHGGRIIGFINGDGLCKKCVEALEKELEETT